MKIRIKGDSIRIRLTRTEVSNLCREGIVRETTRFPSALFSYEVILSDDHHSLQASYENEIVRFYLPATLAEGWPDNSTVGFEEWVQLDDNTSLHLLLEKDFQCLEIRSEDESDQYPNPKALL